MEVRLQEGEEEKEEEGRKKGRKKDTKEKTEPQPGGEEKKVIMKPEWRPQTVFFG